MKVALYCGTYPNKSFTEVEFHHKGYRDDADYKVYRTDENGERKQLSNRPISKPELRALAYALLALTEG